MKLLNVRVKILIIGTRAFIIESSDLVLFYAEERENSGAFKALQYAIKKHKTFKNMFVDGLPHGTL